MTQTYFLGLDISTTSSKALLIEERGEVVAVASSPHTLQTPKPLWSEQDPHQWWQAVSASIQSVLKKAGIRGDRVAAIGLTGQMHGLVLLDEAGKVLRPAILWNDQRTQAQCDEIHRRVGKEQFYSDQRQCSPDRISLRPRSYGCSKTSRRFMQRPAMCCCPRTISVSS